MSDDLQDGSRLQVDIVGHYQRLDGPLALRSVGLARLLLKLRRVEIGVQMHVGLVVAVDGLQELARHAGTHRATVHLDEHGPALVYHVFAMHGTPFYTDGVEYAEGIVYEP